MNAQLVPEEETFCQDNNGVEFASCQGLKRHCMGLNRKEAAPSVPKNILLNLNQTRTRASLLQSITDVSTTALPRITFKSHELKIATTVITRHACLVSCRSFVRRSAAQRQQDIFRY